MKTGFNIVYIKSSNPLVTLQYYGFAIGNFKSKYSPADFVEITEVKHLNTSYNINRKVFTHTFSIYWEEPEHVDVVTTNPGGSFCPVCDSFRCVCGCC